MSISQKIQDVLAGIKKKNAEAENTCFKVEYIEADPSKGFNFPYIMLLPKKMKQDVKIMVECANSKKSEAKRS